jgi:hypothetical protein
MLLIANWIMQNAVRNAPAERADWAEAMHSEFAELNTGRLSWAVGCWLAVAGWQIRSDISYLVAVASVAVMEPPCAYWIAYIIGLTSHSIYPAFHSTSPGYILIEFAAPAPLLMAVGAYRPRRVLVTVFTIAAFQDAWYMYVYSRMGHGFSSLLDVISFLKFSPVSIIEALVFVWLGAWLRKKLAHIPV